MVLTKFVLPPLPPELPKITVVLLIVSVAPIPPVIVKASNRQLVPVRVKLALFVIEIRLETPTFVSPVHVLLAVLVKIYPLDRMLRPPMEKDELSVTVPAEPAKLKIALIELGDNIVVPKPPAGLVLQLTREVFQVPVPPKLLELAAQ
jgi:hypothetical protein